MGRFPLGESVDVQLEDLLRQFLAPAGSVCLKGAFLRRRWERRPRFLGERLERCRAAHQGLVRPGHRAV
jgi:hypothetical protein